MEPERWLQARSAFERALDLPAEEREVFLADLGAVDPGLLAEVEALLGWHELAEGFLAEPPTMPEAVLPVGGRIRQASVSPEKRSDLRR